MTKASKQAYHDEANKKKRATTKELILDFLTHPDNVTKGFTYEEIAACVVELRGNVANTQKRCSDLYKDGKIEIIGTRDGKSLYRFIGHGVICYPKPTDSEIWKRAIKPFVTDDVFNKILTERKAIKKFV